MRAGESLTWFNVAAGTYGASQARNARAGSSTTDFVLQGGTYQIGIVCTGTPSLAIKQLGADGVTYETVYIVPDAAPGTPAVALILSGAFGKVTVPPGRFQIVIGTSTANYVNLTRIPLSE